MSVYEKRYNVHYKGVSHYTDDPAEALRLYQSGIGSEPPPFIHEGYADEEYIGSGHPDYRGIEGTLFTRRTTGKVEPAELEALIERQKGA